MIQTFTFKFLISTLMLFMTANLCNAKPLKFVSLSPGLTEVMYAIGAQDDLLAVSTSCNYPNEALKKDKVGNNFFINKEKIVKLQPDYILAADGTQTSIVDFSKIGIKPLLFEMNSVNAVYGAISHLGKLTGHEKQSKLLIKKIDAQIQSVALKKAKRILYLVQLQPFITIGNKSFIADVIRKSGQISVTENLNEFYPSVSDEYLIKLNPDLIIVSFKADDKKLKKLFPNTKIIFLPQNQSDKINRPGPRIGESVQFFSNL